MLVIDPLSEFADDGVDLNKSKHARSVVKALTRVAREFHCVVLLVHHLNKTSSERRQSALHRGSGSVSGVAGAARSVLMAGRDPQEPTRCVLAVVKHNLAPESPSLCYTIQDAVVTEGGKSFKTSRLDWGAQTALRADDLVLPVALAGNGQNEAEAFLCEFLAEGPRAVRDIQHEASERGLSFAGAVRRASERLGVRKRWNAEGELAGRPARSCYVWALK